MTKNDDEKAKDGSVGVIVERGFFPGCDCDKCNQLNDLLEHIVPLIEKAAQEAFTIEENSETEGDISVAFVLSYFPSILRGLCSGNAESMKVAAAEAVSLADFVGRETSIYCTKHATVEVIMKGLEAMKGMGFPMFSMSAEEVPGLQEAIAAIIAKRGNGPQNLH